MDENFRRALAAAARAFAEVLETPTEAAVSPAFRSAESMRIVLAAIAVINDEEGRGATDTERREIAVRVGMDPRGMAGYYAPAAGLLEIRSDGAWITPT